MNIIVCLKQVPDAAHVKLDPVTHTLKREGVAAVINPFDLFALEAALRLREEADGTIHVLSMGPPQAAEAIKEAIGYGVDEGLLLSDRAFAGADTLATSYTLAAAIKKMGRFDLIICGKQAIDGDTAQVGPEIAECLDIPQVTYVSRIDVNCKAARIEREHEEGIEVLEAPLPMLISVVKSINEPRLPTVKGTMKAARKAIPVWTVNDLDVEHKRLGLKGSPTQVVRIFTPKQRTQGEIIYKDTARAAVLELLGKLSDAKLV